MTEKVQINIQVEPEVAKRLLNANPMARNYAEAGRMCLQRGLQVQEAEEVLVRRGRSGAEILDETPADESDSE